MNRFKLKTDWCCAAINLNVKCHAPEDHVFVEDDFLGANNQMCKRCKWCRSYHNESVKKSRKPGECVLEVPRTLIRGSGITDGGMGYLNLSIRVNPDREILTKEQAERQARINKLINQGTRRHGNNLEHNPRNR